MKLVYTLSKNHLKSFLLILIIFSIGAGFGYSYVAKNTPRGLELAQEKNTQYVGLSPKKAFLAESFEKIMENYWDNLSQAQLIDIFRLAAEKNGSKSLSVKIESKEQLISELLTAQNNLSPDQKSQFIPVVLNTVLGSLNPAGRSGLFTTKEEEQLKNTVENINPEKDLYKDLGVNKGASETAVITAFQKQEEQLKDQNTPEAKDKLKKLTYAKDVLTNTDKKRNYDQKGIEPTIFTKVVSPGILYLQFKKFSPTSLEEFQKAFASYQSNTSLYGLIFDLRGNIGGAIDATAYYLGFFIGKNQYAFDFYHKGVYEPFKTPTDKLASVTKYKQVIILVDNQTQSSAEMMVASLKKYHVGVVVGVPTRGWGTVERVFPLENQLDPKEKYSIFLVHSLTLRDDNQPIEGRGVEPNVNIKEPNWEQQLFNYFRNNQLTEAVKDVISY